jgi:formylglycine-generating enzyme required for sulfatase activity
MLQSGTVLQNRYFIQRLLAQGGMGAVYQAIDQKFDNTVALKECFFTDDRLRKAFEREARMLNRLHHAALPVVFDYFLEGDGAFLVMQFISGDDLGTIIEKRAQYIEPKAIPKPFSPDDVLVWAEQLLDALDYLHTQQPPIIHRDIKPQNLKLAKRNQIILLDFGLAKNTPLLMTRVTTTGSIYGYTPSYAPIEQIRGAGTDPRSDLYALGATLYHLLTGVPPVDAATRADAYLGDEPDPLLPASVINGDVPQAISTVLMKAMEQHRNKRPASAIEMLEMLRAARHSLAIERQARGVDEGRCQDAQTIIAGSQPDEEARKAAEAESQRQLEGQRKKEEIEKQRLQADQEHQSKVEADRLRQEQEQRAREEVERKIQQDEQEYKAREERERIAKQEAELREEMNKLMSEGSSAFDNNNYLVAIQKWEEALRLFPAESSLKDAIALAKRGLEKERQLRETEVERKKQQVREEQERKAREARESRAREEAERIRKERDRRIREEAERRKKREEQEGQEQIRKGRLGISRDNFVRIEAGEFFMGSEDGASNERPVHRVRISRPFEMSKYQVTQAQWEAVMGSKPGRLIFQEADANLPVQSASWEDAQQYIERLNAEGDGYDYRLPTEAEWEYACRAGSKGDYAGKLDAMGWYDSNSGGQTHPVGQKQPNAWGLYDMHGNVYEWCQDWYSKDYYVQSPIVDPQGPASGSKRVIRGGHWTLPAGGCRSAFRGRESPGRRYGCGFRLVRILK